MKSGEGTGVKDPRVECHIMCGLVIQGHLLDGANLSLATANTSGSLLEKVTNLICGKFLASRIPAVDLGFFKD